ncbi:MAG: hypothetical protein J0H78_04995 [Rhizobiales bacterium]|nr:hypothetical protein [Hyphomicrobiales bacterium]
MATKTYETKIKLPNGTIQTVTVQADTSTNARWMLEAQYGKGCLLSSPYELR